MLTRRRFIYGSAGAATLLGACENESGEPSDDLADVIYEGAAIDEALETLLAAPVVDDASRTARFTWPSNGEVLPASEPLHVCWTIGQTAMYRPPSIVVPDVRRPAPHRTPRLSERMLAVLLGGIRSAHAHGKPLNGAGFLLVFSTPEDPKLLRVFTSAMAYIPDAAAQAKLAAVQGVIQVNLLHADFEDNRIARDGGPFRAIPTSFELRSQ